MNQPASLLGARILPPTPGPLHLTRPRLLARIASGLEGRATVVQAGPGYGKTALVARLLQDLPGDSVWYWTDVGDRDPWILFRHLIQGIREHAPEFGDRSEGLWEDLRSRSGEAERLADIFISEAEETLGGRLFLALDDLQNLEASGPCAGALKRLLDYLPGALHLILVGRTIPDLGIKALVAEGAVTLLQGEELLFTSQETRALLLETFGLKIQPEAIDRLHARTRGWVTALQLLRQTARLESGTADLPVEIFARTEAEIFDYFSEEVLAAETREVRDFLLGSAPPSVIDPDVCAQVLRDLDVRHILAGLARRNLFISPLESRGEYYAYDPLFRDFLRRKLRDERTPAERRDLDRRYGRVYSRRGDFAQALAHWMAAEEVRGTVDLLGRHGKALLRAGRIDSVREAALLVARGGTRPAIVDDLLGEACRLRGDHAAAVGHFESALGAGRKGTPELAGNALASTLQGLAYSLLKMGDLTRAAATAETALAVCGDDDPALRSRILNTLSIVRYREDRYEEALTGWQEALTRARQAGDEHLTLMIAHNLGLPHAVMGDFRRASECFHILTSPENPRAGPEEGAAYLNLARIATLRGEPAQAASLLGDAREIARKWNLKGLAADVLEAEGDLLRYGGDFDGARARYARARALFVELGQLNLLEDLAEDEAILAACRGDREEAERLASAALERRRASGPRDGIASALLALGEVRVRAGDPSRAEPVLCESAALFAALRRAYQECTARLWLALARLRNGQTERAEPEATEALRLAATYDYRATVLRLAGLDDGLRQLLASLPQAPAYLKGAAPALEEGPRPAGAAAPPRADLTVRLLGPTEAYRDAERRIPAQAWKIRRALQIFCYLAIARDRRATKDRIVDALWGDVRPTVIEKNFHPTISFLRRALNYGHNVPKNFILCERGAYLLNPEYAYDIDVESFEEKITSARRQAARNDARSALLDYDAARALYRGPLLEEEYDEWVEAPRARLEALYLAALKETGDLHLKEGNAEAALDCLRKAIDHDPLDEEGSGRLMRALGSLGQRAAVEKEYGRLARALKEDLDSGPMPATRQIYERALAEAGKGARRSAAANPGARPAP